jgi:hypothetical protein
VVTAVSGGYSVQITSGGASQTYAIGN